MTHYIYKPVGVCSREISFDLENGKVFNVRFVGGCPGNLLAIGKLINGADATFIVERLKGNDCAGKGTSCADQLAKAIEQAMNQG
ncbi:MAG: TIGR03905 family TSCPD domain-containing protein [Alphaproteobacteria bacterium]|nr:TIGR03905 family TSCPD domain-containing protein [Alphaproteobacteria bacterium]